MIRRLSKTGHAPNTDHVREALRIRRKRSAVQPQSRPETKNEPTAKLILIDNGMDNQGLAGTVNSIFDSGMLEGVSLLRVKSFVDERIVSDPALYARVTGAATLIGAMIAGHDQGRGMDTKVHDPRFVPAHPAYSVYYAVEDALTWETNVNAAIATPEQIGVIVVATQAQIKQINA